MPLYDYRCKECKNEFEKVRKIKDRHDVSCPKCQSDCDLLITGSKKDWFRPHWNDGFDIDPVFVKSKKHYKELCKQHKVTARCL